MPTAVEIREAIEVPVTATPYPYGLFSVLPGQNPIDQHWGFGVEWRSVNCGNTVRVQEDAVCATLDDTWSPDRWCTTATADPFVLYSFVERGSDAYSGARQRVADDARSRFEAGEQAGVEIAVRRRLAAAVPSPTAVSITGYAGTQKVLAGLAWVEQALAEATGNRGVIYMTRFAATLLGDYLKTSGGTLTTPLGTPVAAILSGTTNPPDGTFAVPTATTIYGTGPAFLYRGEVDEFPINQMSTNDWQHKYGRPYLFGWDCTAVAASVTL